MGSKGLRKRKRKTTASKISEKAVEKLKETKLDKTKLTEEELAEEGTVSIFKLSPYLT